jgi:hypothetical protein
MMVMTWEGREGREKGKRKKGEGIREPRSKEIDRHR